MDLTVDGKRVFASTGGKPFDPAQPAIVFLHGAGFDRTTWQLQARWFSHHGRSVLAVDFPGFGKSDGPPLDSVPAMADWVVRLLDAAGLKSAALVGHSMGALVALDYAARHPDRANKLALLGCASEMPVNPDLLGAAQANDPRAWGLMINWGVGRALQIGGMAAPGLWLTQIGLAQLGAKTAQGATHVALAACNAYKDAPARAAEVKCPTLIVSGDGDLMTPAAKAKPLAAAIPGARMTILADAGHFMMVERPDETLAALRTLV